MWRVRLEKATSSCRNFRVEGVNELFSFKKNDNDEGKFVYKIGVLETLMEVRVPSKFIGPKGSLLIDTAVGNMCLSLEDYKKAIEEIVSSKGSKPARVGVSVRVVANYVESFNKRLCDKNTMEVILTGPAQFETIEDEKKRSDIVAIAGDIFSWVSSVNEETDYIQACFGKP